MPASEIEQLRRQIREAFPPVKFHGSVTTCDCEECLDLRKALAGQRWDEVPTAFLDFTCSPVLLDAEAFQAFLPAYMLRGLDDLNDQRVVLEFTVYSLCPEQYPRNSDYVAQRAASVTPAQVQAIRSFLLFVVSHAKNGKWFKRFVDRALDSIWR
jgi:hypothetical protein